MPKFSWSLGGGFRAKCSPPSFPGKVVMSPGEVTSSVRDNDPHNSLVSSSFSVSSPFYLIRNCFCYTLDPEVLFLPTLQCEMRFSNPATGRLASPVLVGPSFLLAWTLPSDLSCDPEGTAYLALCSPRALKSPFLSSTSNSSVTALQHHRSPSRFHCPRLICDLM